MAVLAAHQCVLLVVDMQASLLPAIHDSDALLGRASRLAQAAQLLNVPVIATEHWAQKIGGSAPVLASSFDSVFHKTHFDATREADFLSVLPVGRTKVLLIGTEAHVCVLQTGLGLANLGYTPVLVTDCVGSRKPSDHTAACARWVHHGLELVSAEMAMFEWLETPAHPQFRAVLNLIKTV